MTDYTPTTEEVRAAWIDAHRVDTPLGGRMDMEARPRERIREFDRWMASVLAEQGEPDWEIGYQLIDQWGNSVGVGWPFLTVEEAAEQGERRAREETACDPRFPIWSRVARRRKAGPWLPGEENTPNRTIRSDDDEFAPGECDGSNKCTAPIHVHGCYTPHRSDQCDSPDEYGHTDRTIGAIDE